jgi:hypothetical protein
MGYNYYDMVACTLKISYIQSSHEKVVSNSNYQIEKIEPNSWYHNPTHTWMTGRPPTPPFESTTTHRRYSKRHLLSLQYVAHLEVFFGTKHPKISIVMSSKH